MTFFECLLSTLSTMRWQWSLSALSSPKGDDDSALTGSDRKADSSALTAFPWAEREATATAL
jgi:hypothetical protein